jgi:hypothetical protein
MLASRRVTGYTLINKQTGIIVVMIPVCLEAKPEYFACNSVLG